MVDHTLEKANSRAPSTHPLPGEESSQYFQSVLKDIYRKAKHAPGTITTEDARRLSENLEISDEQAAKMVSAVESYATANEIMHELNSNLGQAPHTSLLTVVNDLRVAVGAMPEDVSVEVLKITQAIVSKMQKAIGHTSAPHPELEVELRNEIAKIEPKVAQGTVTTEEANHLHSLEARAHGHTEKGGLTSVAQSVAARRERQLSLSSDSNPLHDPSHLQTTSVTLTPMEQTHHDKQNNPRRLETALSVNSEFVTTNKRKEAFTDSSNTSHCATEEAYKDRRELSWHDELVSRPKPKVSSENVKQQKAAQYTDGHKGQGLGKQPVSGLHKRENSQPLAEVK